MLLLGIFISKNNRKKLKKSIIRSFQNWVKENRWSKKNRLFSYRSIEKDRSSIFDRNHYWKGCFPRSHTWFVYIHYCSIKLHVFLITISSPWTPWSKKNWLFSYRLIEKDRSSIFDRNRYYRLKMESFLYGLHSRQMTKKK